jgi:hypothetical protein
MMNSIDQVQAAIAAYVLGARRAARLERAYSYDPKAAHAFHIRRVTCLRCARARMAMLARMKVR